MNFVASRESTLSAKLATLLGSASLLTMANAISAYAQGQQVAQAQTAQAEEIPETVLITGSLIRGTAAVGVPVTNLSPMDFKVTGALTTSDLFRTIPQFNVVAGPVATAAANVERGTRVNLRQLDTGSAPRSLMMIDGVRYPPQGNGLCQIDPSIIPDVAIDRVDLLLDGASATYGSDAIGGVFNIILKRYFDGARTEVLFKAGASGGNQYGASQLWGRTWDGGQITLGYQWFDIHATPGNFSDRLTFDHRRWGLDNRNPLGSSMPGTISTGGPSSPDVTNYPATNGQNCTNCYAIPHGTGVPWSNYSSLNGGLGPLSPFSASTLNWATFGTAANGGPSVSPTVGTRNEFNPYQISDYSAAIQFYGEGIYGNRRSQFRNNANGNQLASFQVPTFNPYYPTGGAPTNLRVAYHITFESPSITNAYASSQRYMGGLNISLPYGWAAQAYYSETKDSEFNHVNGTVNKAAVSAALGWTIPVTPASGTTPAVATWTKPASVPYLNLFCDASEFKCNSDTTLKYIEGFNVTSEAMWINEKGIKADGPLFNLPGGAVKAAIGANFTSYHFLIQNNVQNTSNPTISFLSDPESRQVWATFAQLNIPVFSDMNGLPGLRRLEFEASWRHDQYSDHGGTSNPKIAYNWAPIDALTIRGAWGTSFRAPNFGEFSPISNVGWNGWNLGTVFQNNVNIAITCNSGLPPAGSGAEKLFNAGFACGAQPAGLSLNGGGRAAVDAHWRNWFNTTEQTLEPELSTNWGLGFDFAPQNFLKGLDLQATWYSVKINGILRNFGNPTTNRFNDSTVGFVYVVPSDLRDPVTNAQLCPGMDLTPASCPQFQEMVRLALAHPSDTVPAIAQTLIYWINDGGTMNKGFQKTDGIDWNASYDWDWGNLGAWNVGITGTYYLSQKGNTDASTIYGAAITDFYHTTLAGVGGIEQAGVESIPRFKYRARLGWSDGTWSVTGFMDYASHFFHTQTAPPNVNNQCITTGGTTGGGTLPCAIYGYTNIEPSYYTFDLSIGYDTTDKPANEYLRNIGIQLIVANITDRHSSYEYRVATGGGNPAGFDILKNIYGRSFQLRIQKTW